MNRIINYLVFLASFWMVSCNLEQEIEIDLPGYQSHYVVECYLQPNQSYRLLLTRSSNYFAPLGTSQEFLSELLVNGAIVNIYKSGKRIPLGNNLFFDATQQKIYNYTASQIVPPDYDETFRLEIITPDGDSIFATTRILPPVPIDSVVAEFNQTDTLARVLTYFTDNPNESNYYRRMLHKSSLDSFPQQDFTVDDRFVEDRFVFGTGYDYEVGDTVINTIFHIDRNYFQFLETLERAVTSNGNPFGSPSPVVTNLQGNTNVIGIFTGLTYDRKWLIIKR